jgi:hypothetical protein
VSLSPVLLNGRLTRDKLAGGLPSFTLASLHSSSRGAGGGPSMVRVYSCEMIVGEEGVDGTSNSGCSFFVLRQLKAYGINDRSAA